MVFSTSLHTELTLRLPRALVKGIRAMMAERDVTFEEALEEFADRGYSSLKARRHWQEVQDTSSPNWPSWLEGLEPRTTLSPSDGLLGSEEDLRRDARLLHDLLPVVNELLEAVDVGQGSKDIEITMNYCRRAQEVYSLFSAQTRAT